MCVSEKCVCVCGCSQKDSLVGILLDGALLFYLADKQSTLDVILITTDQTSPYNTNVIQLCGVDECI